MAIASTINRAWISAEFSKGIESEQAMVDEAKARAQVPPDPTMAVLYNEIAAADERHRLIIETIATRYGYTPSRTVASGIGETLGRLKEKVSEIGMTSLERIGHDLAARANAIHWSTAWVQAFQSIGDAEGARELAAVLTEEKAHRDALQEGLNRLLLQRLAEESETPAK